MINTNPRPFTSKEVITRDEYGYPTLTRFYSGISQTGVTLFEWAQVNSTTGIVNFRPVLSKDVLTPPATNITDEIFTTGAALDVAISLAHANIENTTVNVTSSDGLTTYVEGTDYTIDYINGEITVLSTGAMVVSTGYLIDYKYMTSAIGDRYWIGGVGTIEWAGKDYQIAQWDGTAWVYTAAVVNMAAYVSDLLLTFFYDGTGLKVLKEGVILKWTLQNAGTGLT